MLATLVYVVPALVVLVVLILEAVIQPVPVSDSIAGHSLSASIRHHISASIRHHFNS